ncbi:MAG: EAL domain-containing protein [Gammaproteobacteria bacterium]|nr:EAL domain-containing protein [Gammaproteobacteria bacterium]
MAEFGDSLRVLLIDDNPDDRVLAVRLLGREFPRLVVHQVKNLRDFEHALRAKYDLVISDSRLAWIDGLALPQQVHERWPDCPLILLVEDGLPNPRIEELHVRLNGSLFNSTKDVSHLTVAVAQALEQARRRRMVQRAAQPQTLDSAYVRLLQEVAVAANESETIDDAIQVCLNRVCAHTGWPVGHARLLMNADHELASTELWHVDEDDFQRFKTFREITQSRPAIAPGGLAGRVLAGMKPVWISDVTKDPQFLRAKLASDIGVKAAFGFPVLVRSEIVAVLEFFADQTILPDEHLLEVMAHVGTQLGRAVERKRAEDRLNYLVHHDILTNLPNRTLFIERLQRAVIDADQHERLVGVLFIDLDHFKNINDTLGHEAGDLLIRSVAERLTGCVRAGDTVSRMSGDEFTLVLSDMGHVDDATCVAQKILDVFAAPFYIVERELFVTPSIGITLYPFDDRDVEGLLRNADIAMYRAKELGRNNYQFYTAELTTRAHQRLTLAGALHRAVNHNEFEIYYQPIVDLESGRITTFEALLRWRHPEWGLTAPMQFIPLAEETGLIISIGEWVLFEACRQARTWQAEGHAGLRVAVNLSARQFQQKRLIAQITDALQGSGLDPDCLELEITESAIMHNTDHTITILQIVAGLGVQLSIDDFGIGYSSLSYLKRFPIDTLKIDRSFIRDTPQDADDAAIASAIIAMARALDIRVIAEGVETEEQLAFLRARRCHGVQGWYFSKPLPAEDVPALLRAEKLPGG